MGASGGGGDAAATCRYTLYNVSFAYNSYFTVAFERVLHNSMSKLCVLFITTLPSFTKVLSCLRSCPTICIHAFFVSAPSAFFSRKTSEAKPSTPCIFTAVNWAQSPASTGTFCVLSMVSSANPVGEGIMTL